MNNSPHRISETKPYTGMSTDELRAATREFDAPTTGDRLPGRPLSQAQRKLWKKAHARKPGRSRVGKGAEIIRLSVEKTVLAKIDADAKAQNTSRSELLTRQWRPATPKSRRKTA